MRRMIENRNSDLTRTCLNNDLEDEHLKFWTTRPNCFIVATRRSDPDKILGLVGYLKKNNDTAELKRLSVRPDARGLGVGKALIKFLMKDAEANGFSRITLYTNNAQEKAIKLYTKLGFKRIRYSLIEYPIIRFFPMFHGHYIIHFSLEL